MIRLRELVLSYSVLYDGAPISTCESGKSVGCDKPRKKERE